MYATCIHCQAGLGRNDLLETLPIGRRIAFDEAAGRLWVVCASCSRWNLVPFDSRFEAIEASERLFRETRLRMSTGQIGLAKTREGTELVRIGMPMQPEMAAWRYAGSLAKRRLRFALTTAPVTIGLAAAAKFLPVVGQMFGPSWLALMSASLLSGALVRRANRRTIASVAVKEAHVKLSRDVVSCIRIDATDPVALRVLLPTIPAYRVLANPFGQLIGETEGQVMVGRVAAEDDDDVDRLQTYLTAESDLSHLFRVIMPIVNEAGAPASVIADATAILSRYDPDPRYILFGKRKNWSKAKRVTLSAASEPRRLALEMLVHEESERRWLAGELMALEAEWVRAEKIAAIADGLVRDSGIERRLGELSEQARRGPG
jgi:hypothetical protein